MIASFALGVQLARGLGVQGYGYYGLALSIITMAGIPGELGLSRLVAREVAIASAHNDRAAITGVIRWSAKTCWILSALVAAAIAVAGAILIWTGSLVLGAAVLLGIPTIPLLALARIYGGALQGLHHITLGQMPANVLRPLFMSLLLFGALLLGAMTVPIAMALSSATAGIVYLIARAWLNTHHSDAASDAFVPTPRVWLASTLPLALTDGMRALQLELTAVLLGAMTIPAEVGLFRVAVVVGTLTAAPMLIVSHAAPPIIARLYAQKNGRGLRKVVRTSAWLQTTGVLLISLPVLIWPEFLLNLVFGAGFAPAAAAMRIVIAGQIANAAFGTNVAILNMTRHERHVTRAMTFGVIVNVATVLLLAKPLGTVGAALGFVASLLCWNVITWMDARRILLVDTSVLTLVTGRRA
jgi:O-antigen/teichoic acid export membrane protein